MSLRVQQASHRFRGSRLHAVEGASLAVEPGELVGIVGPNGSGKTTLLRMLAGLLPPQQGTAELDGHALAQMHGLERARRLGYLPQSHPAPRGLTVAEVVALGRHPHLRGLGVLGAEDVAAVHRAMVSMGLENLAHRRLTSLSGGERQRAFLASVLAQETPYLLLDEPTSALDLHQAGAIMSRLRRLVGDCRLGVAVVMHDLVLASQACDRMVLMDEGHAVAEGTPTQVLTVELLHTVYGPELTVMHHPLTGIPVVLPALTEEPRC